MGSTHVVAETVTVLTRGDPTLHYVAGNSATLHPEPFAHTAWQLLADA